MVHSLLSQIVSHFVGQNDRVQIDFLVMLASLDLFKLIGGIFKAHHFGYFSTIKPNYKKNPNNKTL